jgi:hypothetical protein
MSGIGNKDKGEDGTEVSPLKTKKQLKRRVFSFWINEYDGVGMNVLD